MNDDDSTQPDQSGADDQSQPTSYRGLIIILVALLGLIGLLIVSRVALGG
jgi:hypothetical protein